MDPKIVYNPNQNNWNFFFAVLFAFFLTLAVYILWASKIIPTSIPIFDFLLIVLCVFRLVRLFTYDKITQFARDWFLKKEYTNGVWIKRKPDSGWQLTISDLLDCPWCTGVWLSLPVTFLYFLTPLWWYPMFFLAVAGLASFFQVAGNAVGWSAEILKNKAAESGDFNR